MYSKFYSETESGIIILHFLTGQLILFILFWLTFGKFMFFWGVVEFMSI